MPNPIDRCLRCNHRRQVHAKATMHWYCADCPGTGTARYHRFSGKKVRRKKLAQMTPPERAEARLRRATAAAARARDTLTTAAANLVRLDRLAARLQSLAERRWTEAAEGKSHRRPPRRRVTRFIDLEEHS